KEKGIDENLVFYEKGRNQEDITDDEKEAALKEYAADISNFMIKSDIAGDAFVHDGKVVVTFSAYEDKIKAYVKEKGIDENIVVYEKGQDQNTKGDANCDGQVDLSDAVMIMQALANPNKYGIDGTAEHHLTEQGKLNGDMNGDGLTVGDAQSIQRKLLGLDDTLTIQTPPATNSYSYESYSDLNEALIKQDSSILVDSNNYGELFNKTVSAFGNKDIDLYVPAIDGKACDLRNKEGFSNISLMTAELYNLPWIWYHCKVNNIDVDVKLAYHSVIESSELNSAKNYYEVLKVIAPDAPNPDNYAKFESYQKIYESEITIANGEKVVAMISEIANSSNVYVMFVYEGKLVSIYANKDDLSESFLSSFSLEKI
ncbi:dockerin type I repeat-containing protein, partial [Ruminococcus flavefaciens]